MAWHHRYNSPPRAKSGQSEGSEILGKTCGLKTYGNFLGLDLKLLPLMAERLEPMVRDATANQRVLFIVGTFVNRRKIGPFGEVK